MLKMQEQDYAALAPHSYQRETAHSDPQAFNWQLSGASLKLASPKDSTIDHSGSNRFLDLRRVSGNPWAAAKQPGLELLHTNHSNLPAVFYKGLVPQRTVADLQKQSGGFFSFGSS